ncbi:MAG: glycerophosphodiester phosphodiesterase family protein [Syntrophobacterales bacterium]|jgi:glycerophosphoryl diester phosphodiesterase
MNKCNQERKKSRWLIHRLLKVLVIFSLLLPLISFSKTTLRAEKQLPAKKVWVIGHRGAAGLYPENTLYGFERTLEIGVDGIELDILTTADGVLCVHHDFCLKPEIARTSEKKWVDRKSNISIKSKTFEELQTYDVGRLRPHTKYAGKYPDQQPIDGERIPALGEVIALMKQRSLDDTKLWIEIKTSPEQPDMTPPVEVVVKKVLKVIHDENFESRALVLSWDWRTLVLVQKMAPQIQTAHVSGTGKRIDNIKLRQPGPSPWTAGIDVDDYKGSIPHSIQAAGGQIWCAWGRTLTKKQVQTAHELGLKVVVWTIDSKRDMKKFLKMDVDGIITNRPDRAKQLLSQSD